VTPFERNVRNTIKTMPASSKVCIITNRYPAHPDDTASPFVRDFHVGLKEKGIQVTVFTPLYHTERVEYEEDVIRFRWRGGEKVVGSLNFLNPKELLGLFSFLSNGKEQLLEHLGKTKPDVCLALWALPSGWLAYQARKEMGISYSVWCLGSDIYMWARKPIIRRVIKKVLRGADQLFADGFDLAEKTEEISGKSCLFLPSMRRLPPTPEEKPISKWNNFNFLYVGRWDENKGLEDLIRAFSLIKNRLPSVNLDIVGWGGLERRMRKLIERLQLEGRVKMAKKVPVGLLARYLKAADCLIIPSKSDSIPLVFSEALQMGTPLIVTGVGDMGSLVKRFSLGKVVPPGDAAKLSEAMIEFVQENADYSINISGALKLLSIETAVERYLQTSGFPERSSDSTLHDLSHCGVPWQRDF
jgi:glycosyltransferase involved in cell wall biosynthesis